MTLGRERRALISEIAAPRRFRLGEGDSLAGWVVRRIEPDRVVLASPAGEAVLRLHAATETAPRKP